MHSDGHAPGFGQLWISTAMASSEWSDPIQCTNNAHSDLRRKRQLAGDAEAGGPDRIPEPLDRTGQGADGSEKI